MEAAEEPSHLSRLLARIGGEGDGRAGKLLAQAVVGEAVERMLAAEESLEEHAVMARERVERAHRSAIGAGGSRGQGIERANGGRGVIDVSQGVEVAPVAHDTSHALRFPSLGPG